MTEAEQLFADELRPGDEIGEYRVGRRLGAGGFSVVYEALNPVIGKRAAIKVLDRSISQDLEMVSRFLDEARAVNRIRHRNIIDIYAFGELPDGRQYYVMELLDGLTLAAFLDERGRLSPAELVLVLKGVARALDAAHAQGVIHRDLKPDNVFLTFDDEGAPFPKLLDFGTAKLTQGGAIHQSSPGTLLGTPHYMSPEQCLGEPLDHRSDVYSFGVLVYELLTHTVPFAGENIAGLIVKHAREKPAPPSTVVPNLPAELDAPVLRMLARRPGDRPGSVGQAFAELFAAVQSSGIAPDIRASLPAISIHPGVEVDRARDGSDPTLSEAVPSVWERWRHTRRSVQLAAVAGVVMGTAGSGLVGWSWLGAGSPPPPSLAPSSVDTLGAAGVATAVASGCRPIPATEQCQHPVLIDDMEDGDGNICPSQGRTGKWIAFHDGTGTLSLPHGPITAMSVIPGCRGRSRRALHFKGHAFREWGAGVAAKLGRKRGTAFDLSGFRGVRFWARAESPVRLRVSVATRDTLDASYGGDCSAPPGGVCDDHYAAHRSIGPEWVNYTVRFDTLAQGGWGVKADFDLTRATELHFIVPRPEHASEVSFDVWLDDVALVPASG
jgi:serine/threonine protein kinase